MNLTLSVILYMIVSSGMMIFNKMVMKTFPHAIFVTCLQLYGTAAILSTNMKDMRIGSLREMAIWIPIPVTFALMLWLSMKSYERNSVSTIIVFKNLAPLITLTLESIFKLEGNIKKQGRLFLPLVIILIGSFLYGFHDVEVTLLGFILISTNTIIACINRLIERYVMSTINVNMSISGMMLLNNGLGFILLQPLLFTLESLTDIKKDLHGLSDTSTVWLCGSIICGFAISFAGLNLQRRISATSFMITTNVNKFIVIYVDIMLWNKQFNLLTALGATLAIFGGILYGYMVKVLVQEKYEPLESYDNPNEDSKSPSDFENILK